MWEQIPGETVGDTNSARLWVPDGWLVRTISWVDNLNGAAVAVTQTPVPDPGHRWKLKDKEE